jgi:Carboxypeptidase regulatory-like domain/TonB dependent receptor
MFKRHLTSSTAFAVLALALAAPAVYAQETTSSIRGAVSDAAGAPVAGAAVVVTHMPSGTRAVATTAADGSFDARGLRVGGPYQVVVSATGFEKQTVSEISLNVGEPFRFAVSLTPDSAAQEEIVVVASKLKRAIALETGSATSYNAEAIAGVASVSRDLRDVLRRDPLVSFDPATRSISVAGATGRSNRFSVDGVSIQDDFGLNQGGLPSLRGIISIEAVDQFALNSAPFDIAEGNFTGGSINAILKSGTNDYKGAGYFIYGSDNLYGSKLRGVPQIVDFTFKDYGAFLSGPIIKDKLFLALNYEKLTEGTPYDTGLAGEGFANTVPNIGDRTTNADDRAVVDQVRGILKSVYNFDAQDAVKSLPERDRKISAKLDWNVTDDHRVALTYINHFNAVPPQGSAFAGSTSATAPYLGLQSNFYETTEASKIYTGQVNSRWSDILSTEFRLSYRDYKRGQIPYGAPAGGPDFGQFTVCTAPTSVVSAPGATVTDTLTNCGNTARIILGPDVFRQANELATTNLNGAFTANLKLSDHSIKLRGEYQRVRVTNLFVPNSDGAFYFDSIADLQNRKANSVTYANALTANPRDALAKFGYRQFTIAAQDTWSVTDSLTILAGLRYDWLDQDQNVVLNPNFVKRYGFANTKTLNGLGLLQPRLGFNWEATDRLKLSGGAGLFGGGSPVVFISNSYSNDGFRLNSITLNRTATGFIDTAASPALTNPAVGGVSVGSGALDGVNGLSFPSVVDAYLGLGNPLAPPISNAPVNSIAQDFKLPSTWRYNISAKYEADLGPVGDGWNLRGDLLYTEVKNGLMWTDLRSGASIGTLPDGRPRYNAVAGANSDIQLLNSKQGRAIIASLGLAKDWTFGLGFGVSYTFSDVKDVVSFTGSSTANGGYDVVARDPNKAEVGRSSLEIRDNFKLRLSFKRDFFGDNETRLELFGERRSGRPFTYTFGDNSPNNAAINCGGTRSCVFGTRGNNRYQLYVPDFSQTVTRNGTGQPVLGFVTFQDDATLANFRALVESSSLNNYQGRIVDKGSERNPSYTKLDIRVSQQIPFVYGKITAFADVENFLNLLNSNWNSFRQYGDQVKVVDVRCTPTPVAANPTACPGYLYSNFSVPTLNATTKQSLWAVRLGVRYEF